MSEPIPAPVADASERRAERRYAAMTRAKITFGEPVAELECVVRNISLSGALLVMRSTAPVPDVFSLSSIYHPSLPCRVAWRTTRRLGVQFGDIPIRPIAG